MATYEEILNHYTKDVVRKEISDFVRGRWVALEGRVKGNRTFIRYLRNKPLTIKSPEEVTSLIRRFRGIGVRTVYATVNIYRDLARAEAVEDLGNVVRTTPFWDVDTELSKWEYAVRAAELISEYLESWGVRKSLYVMWSGEGMHVRISENAFSEELIRSTHPIDVAYAVVEFVLRGVRDRLMRIVEDSGEVLKVENLIDAKRVFTSPLSIHRRLDLVAVCMKPDDLSSFNPSWADIHGFKHRDVWRLFDKGEADDLARRALKVVGKGKTTGPSVRSARIGTQQNRKESKSRHAGVGKGRIGRFEVMALLQAARYYILMGDLSKALSFGLNRAIFYAWAKHYGRAYAARRYAGVKPGGISEGGFRLVRIAGEEVPQSSSGWFTIGGKEQLPEDFDRNVARKIESVIPYDLAWESALKYVGSFPKEVIGDQRMFYEKIYKPVRDAFIEKVVNASITGSEEDNKEGEVGKQKTKPRNNTSMEGSRGKRGVSRRRTLLDWVSK